MNRIQRRRQRRKRWEELHVSCRWYREARRTGESPADAYWTATNRTMKRCYLPGIMRMFSAPNVLLRLSQ